MLDYKIALGIVAIIIGFIGYGFYIRDIYRGTTKPHLFSWIVWTIIQAVAGAASFLHGGGPAAWVISSAAFLCFGISVYAMFWGERNIDFFDWVSFVCALLGIVAWVLTANALWAVIIVSIADFFGFVPTFRKVVMRPDEETLSNYLASGVANVLTLGAIRSYSLTTILYPLSLVFTNCIFVLFALHRRSILKRHA